MNFSNRSTLLIAAAVLTGFVLSYCSGKSAGAAAERLHADKARLDTTEQIRHVAAETAKVAVQAVALQRPATQRAHDAVRILDASTLEVRVTPSAQPERIAVPTIVVTRLLTDSVQMRKDSLAIASLQTALSADSNTIRAQANVIRDLEATKTPRCGKKCGALMGVGAVVLGALAVEQVRALVRPAPSRAFNIPAFHLVF